MTETKGKTAVVTGGGSGIGRALARALAAQGSPVVVADIQLESAEAVTAEITEAGGTALSVACDVSERGSVAEMKARTLTGLGPPALLFANAGATCLDRLSDMSPDDVEWIVSVNLLGVSHCLQAFLPDMIAAGSGHVAATASLAGLVPEAVPFHSPYAAAKAGVIAMMLNLRTELAQAGVGCTVFCPGGVATRIADTPRYRPERFGGPSDDPLRPPKGFELAAPVVPRPAEEAAEMLLRGVRSDRPLVVTDTTLREAFLHGFVDEAVAAFDAAAAFDRETARSDAPAR